MTNDIFPLLFAFLLALVVLLFLIGKSAQMKQRASERKRAEREVLNRVSQETQKSNPRGARRAG